MAQERIIYTDTVPEPKTLTLGEITITALGLERQERALGYSVTTVKGDDLDQNTVNPITALQGKVAGLNISGADGGLYGRQKITLRGASTLSDNNQPLIIVDGVVMNSVPHEGIPYWYWGSNDFGDQMNSLNNADIKNVSVLKGAASTALYGSRGMNGALVITTKNGGLNKGIGVAISQSMGFDLITATPDLQTEYGPGTIAGNIFYGERDAEGNFYRWDTKQFYIDGSGRATLVGADGMGWGPHYDGREIIYYDGSTGKYTPQKNAYRDFYQPGFNTNTNVIVRGGTEKTLFYLSANYRYANGTLPSTSFSRGSVLLKGTHRISNKTSVEAQVSLSDTRPQNPPPGLGNYFVTGQVNQLYDSRYYRYRYKGEHGGIANSTHADSYADVPLKDLWWRLYENSYEQQNLSVLPSFAVNAAFTEWLSFRAEGSMNYYTTRRETKELGQGYVNEGNDDLSGGHYELLQTGSREGNVAASLFADRNLGDFTIGGFFRGEYRNNFADRTVNGTTQGLISPGEYFIGNSRGTPHTEAVTLARKRVFSAVAAANVSWKEQLYLEITGRNDWSSSLVYSNGCGNYSYFYPSASVSWIMSETFRLPRWITFGKLRASWAQVGSDTEPFVINPGYEQKKYMQPDGSYIYSQSVPPILYGDGAYLKPERKNAFEIGANWQFIDGRIGADIALYRENTRDQIMNITLPKESGVASQLVNAGNIRSEGIEVMFHTVPVRNRDWQWSIDLTYAKNNNKILELHPNVQDRILLDGGLGVGTDRIASVAIAGGSYGLLVSDIMPERDEEGNVILSWLDEYRAAYPKRSNKVGVIGKMTPDFTGSVATALQYKNITLQALIDVRVGGLVASYSNRYGTAYGLTESSLQYRDSGSGGIIFTSGYADSYGQQFHDGVIPEGVFDKGTIVTTPSGNQVDISGMSFREAYEKGYVEPVRASDYQYWRNCWSAGTVNDDWVHKVNYIALREISVAYRLPDKIASRLSAKALNVSISGRNLAYLYNSLPNNLHPEGLVGTTTAEFRERGFIPYTSSFIATITVDF